MQDYFQEHFSHYLKQFVLRQDTEPQTAPDVLVTGAVLGGGGNVTLSLDPPVAHLTGSLHQ